MTRIEFLKDALDFHKEMLVQHDARSYPEIREFHEECIKIIQDWLKELEVTSG